MGTSGRAGRRAALLLSLALHGLIAVGLWAAIGGRGAEPTGAAGGGVEGPRAVDVLPLRAQPPSVVAPAPGEEQPAHPARGSAAPVRAGREAAASATGEAARPPPSAAPAASVGGGPAGGGAGAAAAPAAPGPGGTVRAGDGTTAAGPAPPLPPPSLARAPDIDEYVARADPHLPEAVRAQHRNSELSLTAELCADTGGSITRVAIRAGIPGADEDVARTLRGWRLKPQPVPICWPQRIEFTVE